MAHVSILCSTWGRAVSFLGSAERILWAIVLLGERANIPAGMPVATMNKSRKPKIHDPNYPRHRGFMAINPYGANVGPQERPKWE